MRRNIIINKGSSLITIPKALAEALKLEKGKKVDITIVGKRIVVEPLEER